MNKYLTLSEIVQKVITALSQYQGTSTQKYAEDRISEMVLLLYNKLFDSRTWYLHTKWFKYTLTGTNGVCAEDVSKDIASFYDICSISTEINPNYELKRMHLSTNPFLISGNVASYYIPSTDNKKVFAVVPFNATGTIYVRAKVRPMEFLPDTEIPFDPDVLIYGVCYQYCADDGNSSTQIQKFEKLYQERLQTLTSLDNSGTFDWNDEEARYSVNQWR